jgi:hypothetical protein
MAWNEWEQIKAEGAQRQLTQLQLNRLDGGPGVSGGAGGTPDFVSTPAQKKAAANTIETELEPDTKKATEHADETTGTTIRGFDGWDTAVGLKKVATTWDQQVKALMGRLAFEKGALRRTSGFFVGNDKAIGAQVRTISVPSNLRGL